MVAALVPRQPPYGHPNNGDDGDDNNGNNGGGSSPTASFGSANLVIEDIDPEGNIIVEVDYEYTTFSITVSSGSPLPNAATTSDPSSLLQTGSATPTPDAASSAGHGPYSDATSSGSMTQTSSGSGGQPTQSPADAQSAAGGNPPEGQDDHHSGSPPIGAMVVAPIAILAVIILGIFFWRRKRAARRDPMVAHEKMRSPEEGLSRGPPGYNESTNGLLMTPAAAATPLSARTASNSLGPSTSRANRASQQPVILNTEMSGGAYFTGIDTSDAVSMASGGQHADGRRSIDVTSLTSSDEPPPPYRPRSVPSISRETSLRNPGQGLAVNTELAAVSERSLNRRDRRDNDDLTPTAETTPMRNPFDDPDDDAVSDLSTPVQSPRWRRRGGEDEDSQSMISEFSFEHEHR